MIRPSYIAVALENRNWDAETAVDLSGPAAQFLTVLDEELEHGSVVDFLRDLAEIVDNVGSTLWVVT